MILNYDKRPEATVDQKVQSLMESTQLALNDISRAQETADVAKNDAQTSVALAETARTAANEASDSARIAKQAADDATDAVEAIEGDVSGLTTRVAQAETDIDATEGSIVALGTRVGTAETNITNIEGNVTSLTGRVSDAEDDINAVEGDITSLQSDVSTAQGNITTIQGNLTSLTGRVSAAEGDITTVEGDITSLQGRVSDAEDDVEDVMKGLSLAENVVGTLNWITAHSTITTDTTPQAGTTYYIKHLDGTFEIVTDTTGKNPAQEGWYVLDEALQNYVLSHLSLTDDGLYVMADGSEWKVKISDDGVYILDPNNQPANQMTGTGNVIGYEGETHAEIDYHSLQLTDKEGNVYFHVSDLRDKDDGYQAIVTETYIGNGVNRWFRVNASVSEEVSAVDGSDSSNKATLEDTSYVFTRPPANGAEVTIIYKTTEIIAKAFTLGKRAYRSNIGLMSIAEGNDVTASGQYSHAEGNSTKAEGYCAHAEGSCAWARGYYSHAEGSAKAIGQSSHAEGAGSIATGTYSHAEGYGTEADGFCSHAQNCETITGHSYQTAIGKYNDNQSDNLFEIGNGTSDSDRSNAYAVTTGGIVKARDKLNKYSDIFDLLRPVGSYYYTDDADFDPNDSWGGTWSLLGEGQVLLSGSASGSYRVGAQYGGNTKSYTPAGSVGNHTLNVSEIPSHTHGVGTNNRFVVTNKAINLWLTGKRAYTASSSSGFAYMGTDDSTGAVSEWENMTFTGGGGAHNHGFTGTATSIDVMQSSTAVYIWHRNA